MTNSPPKITNVDSRPFRIKPGFTDESEAVAVESSGDLIDVGDQPERGVDQSLKTELEEGVDAITGGENTANQAKNRAEDEEQQLTEMAKEEIQSYPLYGEDGRVITLIKGQTWIIGENGSPTSKRISALRIGENKDQLLIGFNDEKPEEKSTAEWKLIFSQAELSRDGEHELERAKISEAVKYSSKSVEPVEASGVAYQDGEIVKENIVPVPQVTVAPAEVEQPSAAEEIAAGVPKDVVEAEQQIAQVVETAVSPVVAEEKVMATGVQEPPTDTSGTPSIAETHQKLVSGVGDAGASEAAKVEEVWNPLED